MPTKRKQLEEQLTLPQVETLDDVWDLAYQAGYDDGYDSGYEDCLAHAQ